MTENLIQELQKLSQYAGALQSMIGAAAAQTPQRAVGTDPSATVTITLDARGLPNRVTIANDWLRRLEPFELGGAVTAAFEDALRSRLTGWETSLRSTGWVEDFEELQQDLDGPSPRRPVNPSPLPVFSAPIPAHPRPVGDVAEDAIKAIDQARARVVELETAPPIEGSVANGKLTLAIDRSGTLSALIDEQWAGRQSAAGLMGYFDQALGIVALKAGRMQQADDLGAGLGSLLGEALALIKQSPISTRN